MNQVKKIEKNAFSRAFALAAVLLLLLSSCPIKTGIRSLAGIPVQTGHHSSKGNYVFLGSSLERCINVETVDTKVVEAGFTFQCDARHDDIFAAVSSFIFDASTGDQPPHPLYGSVKPGSTVPIFLQCRKLII